jgi:hypothetical protein
LTPLWRRPQLAFHAADYIQPAEKLSTRGATDLRRIQDSRRRDGIARAQIT